jgi:superfamily II DNA/RNA helicase
MRCHAPNAIQEEALRAAMEGESVLVCAQTGSGKTLVALLPLLNRACSAMRANGGTGRAFEALLVAPTADLVRQHAAVATALTAELERPPAITCVLDDGGGGGGGDAGTRSSSATDAATNADADTVASTSSCSSSSSSSSSGGSSTVFVATPAGARALARRRAWDAVAIDEVDAVLCGNAQDDELAPAGDALVRQLLRGGEQLLLTTAHLTPAHEAALVRRFPGARRVRQRLASGGRAGALVPTLKQVFHYFSGDAAAKERRLLDALGGGASEGSGGSAMVFCGSNAQAAHLQRVVEGALPALRPGALHGAMPDAQRAAALGAFRAGESRVLLCTEIAARGLDVPELAHVVMYDMPADVVAYVHCAGRTARRGSSGRVTCLVNSRQEAGHYRKLHALQHAAKLEFAEEPR